jgi:hypothetical protein
VFSISVLPGTRSPPPLLVVDIIMSDGLIQLLPFGDKFDGDRTPATVGHPDIGAAI